MKEHIENRWAFVCSLEREFFLGKYCWNNGIRDDIQVRTFRTRKLARKAKKELRCYKKAKIVKVEVEIRLVPGEFHCELGKNHCISGLSDCENQSVVNGYCKHFKPKI